MKFSKKLLVIISFTIVFSPVSFAMEVLFYSQRSESPDHIKATQHAQQSLEKNYRLINILAVEAYQIHDDGVVEGFVDPEILKFVNLHSIKLMVLVRNANVNGSVWNHFLQNADAQQRAIHTLALACKKNHYYGVQFSFSNVPVQYQQALTHFYVTATQALHKQGLIVSYAFAPVLTSAPLESDFLSDQYQHAAGANDFKILGDNSDFVSILTYNQHVKQTTPGASANISWVEKAIKYTLKYVPAEKISLGIPVYSNYWYTGREPYSSAKKITMQMATINFDKAHYLLEKYHANLQWDNINKINYSVYQHHWLNEYLFLEDANSFNAKYKLAEKFHLRGISVYDLGSEDPAIWNLVSKQTLNKK